MFRKLASLTLKVSLGLGLIAWLVLSGRLELATLSKVLSNPSFVVLALLVWVVGPFILGAVRWVQLLRGAGISLEGYRGAWKLQLIGLFFNSALPGAVSGDIVKTYYAIGQTRARAQGPVWAALMDRILGVVAMFLLSAVAVAYFYPVLWEHLPLRPVVGIILGFSAAAVVALCALSHEGVARWLWGAGLRMPGVRSVLPLNPSGKRGQYLKMRASVLRGLGISILVQMVCMFFFVAISYFVDGVLPPIGKVLVVYPIGILLSSVPLLPGGAGVGHVAFEELYAVAGMDNGANVFNIYMVTFLALNLSGVVPYLTVRRYAGAVKI